MNLVYQYYIGELPMYARLSSASFSKYASRCGAEYKLDLHPFLPEDDEFGIDYTKYYEKVRLFLDPAFDAYEHVLYTDTDVLVKRYGKNIFNIPYEDVMAIEGSQIKCGPWDTHFNSGVMLLSKKTRLMGRRNFQDWKSWVRDRLHLPYIEQLDECYLNDMFREWLNVTPLGLNWNTWYRERDTIPKDTIRFMHFSNWDKDYMIADLFDSYGDLN